MKTSNCSFCLKPDKVRFLFSDNKFHFFFCSVCKTGFIYPYPKPKELAKYYHENYWTSPGVLGFIRRFIFDFFQTRRKRWIMRYFKKGKILDVGAGEGKFAKSLNNRFEVTSLDVPSSKIINKSVLKVDFLNWRTNDKFDAIVFWESLEHTPKPEQYLKKASQLLKNEGLTFIEYPCFDSIESKLFNKHWFHLDPPRHHSYFTKSGMEKTISRAGLVKISHKGIPAFEYAIWGFVGSALNKVGLRMADILKQNRSLLLLLLISPFFALVILIETFFLLIGQSPIWLMIAKKDSRNPVP